MPLQLGEIVEGIGAAAFGRVDQGHEKVAGFRAIFGEIKQTVLSSYSARSSKIMRHKNA